MTQNKYLWVVGTREPVLSLGNQIELSCYFIDKFSPLIHYDNFRSSKAAYMNLATLTAVLPGRAVASAHFEKQSVKVMMYLLPSDVSGREPIKSILTWCQI